MLSAAAAQLSLLLHCCTAALFATAFHPWPSCLQAVLVQELRWQQGAVGDGPGGPDSSAVAAKQAYITVQAAVAVLQLQQVRS